VVRVVAGTESPAAHIVAALHDLVESTDWTLDGLRAEGFDEDVVSAVDALTKRTGESYESLVARAGENALAREVKLADLADNIKQTCRAADTEENRERLARYRRALDLLSTEARENG
jgi:(p)ppGpp synthase/HD superfamily hydrolase